MSWVSYPFTLAQLLDSLVRVSRRGIRDRIPSHLGLYVFTVANAWPIHIKAFVRLGPEGPYNPRPPHGTNRTPTTRPTRPSPCSWPRPLRRAPRTYVQGPLRCGLGQEQGDGRVGRVVGVRFVPWGGLGLYGPSGPSLTNAFMCMGQAFATVNTYSPR